MSQGWLLFEHLKMGQSSVNALLTGPQKHETECVLEAGVVSVRTWTEEADPKSAESLNLLPDSTPPSGSGIQSCPPASLPGKYSPAAISLRNGRPRPPGTLGGFRKGFR